MSDNSHHRPEDVAGESFYESSVDALLLDRLQTIDLTLMQLQEKLKKLPALKTIQLAQSEKKKVSARCLALTAKMKDLQLEAKDLDATRTQIENDRKRLTQQIQEDGSNHRALTDAELALSNLAKRLDKTEYSAAKVTSQLVPLQKEMDQLKSRDEALERTLADAHEQVTQTTREMRAQVKELQEERGRCVRDIGEGLYQHYTEAQKQFRGLAVERLEGSKPSICRVELASSALASLKEESSAVQECPYCRRILLVEKQ